MRKHIPNDLSEASDDVLWRLQNCDGYMDLKMWARAEAELSTVPAKFRESNIYRQLSLRIAIEQKRWTEAVELANLLMEREPSEPAYWIHLAYATRRFKGVESAVTILKKALKQFPHLAVIPFNLACYECQLGHTQKALKFLKRAIKLDPKYVGVAMEDEDLEPLWPQLES